MFYPYKVHELSSRTKQSDRRLYRQARLLSGLACLLLAGMVWLLLQAQPTVSFPAHFLAHFPAHSATDSAAGSASDEVSPQIYLPAVQGAEAARLLIAAAHIDSTLIGEADEAILLWNVGGQPQSLAGWQISTRTRRATFPADATLTIQPRQRIWCTAQSQAFLQTFGEPPACTWDDPAPTLPGLTQLEGRLILANAGGFIQLHTPTNQTVDTFVYGTVEGIFSGWESPPALLYTRGGLRVAGQIWHRKQHPDTGFPIDTDQASDWAGDLADVAWGRRVRRPGWLGWDAATLARPQHGEAASWVTIAVAPEGLYAPLAHHLSHAQSTIDLGLYTFEHPELAQVVAQAAARGVQVRLLLEGSPPGGITLLQRWAVAQMAQAGVQVYYSAVQPGAPNGYATRYRFTHAKYGIIDGQIAFTGSENMSRDAMPLPAAGPQGGRRGYHLFTNASPVVSALQRLFETDFAPHQYLDLLAYDPLHPRYGAPPSDYMLPPPPAHFVNDAPFAQAVTVEGHARFVVISAPEHALRPDDGLHALLKRAGSGDAIWVQQLYEQKHWGSADSNPIADPNPRLQMLIEAARRGAQVRVLLDSLFDDAENLRSNRATVDYLHTVAALEGLDIEVRRGNPTGGGIHAKLYLVRVDGEHWSAVGSLNGSEISHKENREVLLLTDMPGVFEGLAEVFWWDWAHSAP